ncbi:hypothetical protein EKO27_g10657 [Xylaria grammica]|uniref:Uncharacterized protein n=1 Tax=Xylaria grammica TaxID=363999 RepID=A0A439CQM0_9PEZI|nr:hypothetical protein EKO27_g10657 [Xylaria grammica]
MLFTNECCHDPISESSVPLISGDFQGAPFPGIRGVVLTSLPTCPDYGLPLLIVSNETSCKNPQSDSSANSGVIGKCQSFAVNEISSFQFVCYGNGVSSVPLLSTTTSRQRQSAPPTTTWAQNETQRTPTSTWGWGGGAYEAGPTLMIIPTGKETKDSDADGRFRAAPTVTMNDTLYEVRQPRAEYGPPREEPRNCNGGDTVSRRDSAPALVCLVTIWLLISLL